MPRIPRKVQYIWFGRGIKSELIQKCMNTTRAILSDWEICIWDEDTYDITSCDYIREAYEKKMYAFASDYARFDILYQHGGVYLDTDVELLKAFPEEFLCETGFTGVESNNKIAPGLVFACEAGNPIVKEILEDYRGDHFVDENGNVNRKTVVERVTEIFARHGFKKDGREQILDGFHIYPAEYFCAFDFVTNEFEITDRTISIHHYTATWTNIKSKTKKKIQSILRKTLGIKGYKVIISIKRKMFGVHGE